MRRPSLLASATAAVFLLAVAAAPAASPEPGPIVNVELGLKTNNGLRAQLETADDGTVTLEIRDEDQAVNYETRGKVTKQGLRVRFGRLGLIDVAFTPTKTLNSTEPSEGCMGEPRTLREGTFAGTIDFTGERNYVRIKAAEAEGTMSVISQWECPEEAAPLARTARRRAASLLVFSDRCICLFAAGLHFHKGRARTVFYGYKSESREGMEIARAVVARGGASTFAVDLMAGNATVRPPRPFRGRATLERGFGDDPLWRSTIRMPFLGAASVNPRSPDLYLEFDPGYDFFDPGPDIID